LYREFGGFKSDILFLDEDRRRASSTCNSLCLWRRCRLGLLSEPLSVVSDSLLSYCFLYERRSEPLDERVEPFLSNLLPDSSPDNCCGLDNFSLVFLLDLGLSKFALFRFSVKGVVGREFPPTLPPLFLLSPPGVPADRPPELSSLLLLGADPK
jgi:hypothetical protein